MPSLTHTATSAVQTLIQVTQVWHLNHLNNCLNGLNRLSTRMHAPTHARTYAAVQQRTHAGMHARTHARTHGQAEARKAEMRFIGRVNRPSLTSAEGQNRVRAALDLSATLCASCVLYLGRGAIDRIFNRCIRRSTQPLTADWSRQKSEHYAAPPAQAPHQPQFSLVVSCTFDHLKHIIRSTQSVNISCCCCAACTHCPERIKYSMLGSLC